MMYGYDVPNMGWWMILSTIFWLALAAVAVWVLVRFLARQPGASDRQSTPGNSAGPSAEEILRQRFARGEIDAETFERMRAQLEQTPARDPALPGGSR